MGSGYTHVDQTANPRAYIQRLDEMVASPFWQSIKQLSYAMLEPDAGEALLDLGCGAGDDARNLARQVGERGFVVGLDASWRMVSEARQRGADDGAPSYCQGDAVQLPFSGATFHGCRCERVLQHLGDPAAALRELIRVTRPGGRIVVVEPDYGTLTIHGADSGVSAAIGAERVQHFRSGRIGHELPSLLRALRLTIRDLKIITQVNQEFHPETRAMLRRRYADPAVAAGTISSAEAERWLSDLESAGASGRYRHAIQIFVVRAIKQ